MSRACGEEGWVRRHRDPLIKAPGPDMLWAGSEVPLRVSSWEQPSIAGPLVTPEVRAGILDGLPSQPPSSLSFSVPRCRPHSRDKSALGSRHVGFCRFGAEANVWSLRLQMAMRPKPFPAAPGPRVWAEHTCALGSAHRSGSQRAVTARADDRPEASP